MDLSLAATQARTARRRVRVWPTLVVLLLGVLTTLPYLYAVWTVPADRVYTGLQLDAPDTLQYFSWLRDHRTALLVPNRMTSQPNEPALFNAVWLLLAQVQNVTGWSSAAIFQVLRLVGGVTFAAATWWLFGLIARTRREQGWAWALTMCGGGLGVVWVIEKYALGLPDVRYPFDLYVAEPNTVLSLLSYPHFLVAGALLVAVFAAALRAEQGAWRWWIVSAVCALVLSLQHAYDLLTIYAVLGGWIMLLTWQRRAIPWRTVGGAFVVGVVSFPPAGYFAWLTSRDPMWQAVLAQFENAGVWTPNLLHLPILMGVPLIVAAVTLGGIGSLRRRSAGELLIVVWALAGLVLIYLPVDFQIHLLNPWQVPLALLAVWGVERRIVPWVARRKRAAVRWLLPALLIVSLPTNVYLVTWRFVELARHDAPYFLRSNEAAALGWLQANTTREDVVLSPLDLGQFVPAYADARTVVGHWAQTVDFYTARDDAARATDPATPAAERQAILARYGATLVLAPQPLQDPALAPVWHNGSLTIYATELHHAQP